MVELQCRHCGWRNEPGARMCGGCGRPLREIVAAGASAAHRIPPVGNDAPTVVDVPPVVRPPARRQPSTVNWEAMPDAPKWSLRTGASAGRALLILLIVVMVALLAGAGAWAAVIRPQLHQQIEGTLRSQLDGVVATVNQQPYIPTTTRSIPAADVTATLQGQIPSGLPVQNMHVSFSGGRVIVSFTTNGFDGAVSTALRAKNGRLVAAATEVDGPLALVESGSEMEQVINDGLGKVRTDISVKQVTLDNDVMTVAINGNVAIPGQS